MTDILGRIDAAVAGRCPCGADPAPGSAWCSEDCRPSHEGPDTFGSDAMRWSAEPPPVGGLCPCGCGLSVAEIMGWELVEPVVEEGSRVGVMRAAGGGGGGRPEGWIAPAWGGNGRVGHGRGAEPSLIIMDEAHVFADRAAVDGVLSILAGEPLEHWEARQVRDDRLVEGCEALLGQRLPEWMRLVLNGWLRGGIDRG